MKRLRSGLRRYQAQRRLMGGRMQAYTFDEPEPYACRLAALRMEIDRMDQRHKLLEEGIVKLQERIHVAAKRSWGALIGAPFFWQRLDRKSVV